MDAVFGPSASASCGEEDELLDAMPPFLTGGETIDNVTEQDATGIYATAATLTYVDTVGFRVIEQRERTLVAYRMERLDELDFADIIGHPDLAFHHEAISFNVQGIRPHDMASILDEENAAIRAGYHCTQPLLAWLGCEPCCPATKGNMLCASPIQLAQDGIISLSEAVTSRIQPTRTHSLRS